MFAWIPVMIPSSICAAASDKDLLKAQFLNPSADTRPRCYWYWMEGNITKDGITKDLEAMERVGIGSAYIGLIHGQTDAKPEGIKILSKPFWDVMAHAIREGTRLGVDIGIFNSPGWSQSGGPWEKTATCDAPHRHAGDAATWTAAAGSASKHLH